MSQWGANGYAQKGYDYRRILAHYYENTNLSRRSPTPVRVLLQANRPSIAFRGAIRAGDRGLAPGSYYTATREGGSVVLKSDSGRRLATYPGLMGVRGGDSLRLLRRSDNGVTDGLYRGSLEIRTAAGPGLNAINVVGSEDYLQGVVPAESPPIWPPAALQAQAVAARSYAFSTSVGGNGFDHYADTRSQMYRGVTAETAATNAAVAATSGEVLTYGGAVITTFFFSTSGGYTENVENVFSGSDPKPWLKGVRDPFDGGSPYHRWGPYQWTRTLLQARLGNLVKGRFRSLRVLQRGVSPRIVKAQVIGTRGRTTVTGSRLRSALDLRDSWLYVRRVSTGAAPAEARTSSGTRDLASIGGTIEPAAGRFVELQQLKSGRWTHVADVPLFRKGENGTYSFHVSKKGSYRVRSGWAKGPVISVAPHRR
jgi:stage II sporulation protein D